MADLKISQLTAKGTAIANTDLVEISQSDGAGGYITKSVTGANIIGSKQDTLISGTNIKTINSTTILGSGDLTVQPTLVSGTNIKTIEGQSILGSGNINITNNDVGLGNVDNTSDLNKPISTATQTALNTKQNTITNSDSITEGVTNLFLTTGERTKLTNTSGTNTGDQTNITGNAATVTTNANLTGPVTSIGNATAIANGAISNAMLANGAVANLSGTNTGDNATNSQYSGLVSNATHTGDAEGNVGLTVKGINNTILSTLGTGILKNTTGTGVPSIAVAADFPTLNQNTTGTADNVTGIVAVANGGTGTATPSLVAGTNVTITGTFPNQTINSSGGGGGGTEIGALIGGGVVVAVFNQNGVNKALVASLTNLSASVQWTISAFQSIAIGATARSFHDGLSNTNAIIAQTLLPASTSYAAGLARLFAGGGFSDWYLPSTWELNMCFNSAAIIAKVTGVTSFVTTNYWNSTEADASSGGVQQFNNGSITSFGKGAGLNVRAVRIHTI